MATGPVKSVKDAIPMKVIKCDALEIVGKVQKPRVFYIIERGRLNVDSQFLLERDLAKELQKTVEGKPF